MLNIFFGNMPEAVFNTAVFFKNDYEDEWITDPLVKEMILDVDHSCVIDSGVIDSPILGKIPPLSLSGGVKTLILVKFEPQKVFNASTCGDNCAKWLLEIARVEDRTVNLRHIMDFGEEPFEVHVMNNDRTVHSMAELQGVLDSPSDHIASEEFFSWECFFTKLLAEETRGTCLQYSKSQLNPSYLMGNVREGILQQMDRIDLQNR